MMPPHRDETEYRLERLDKITAAMELKGMATYEKIIVEIHKLAEKIGNLEVRIAKLETRIGTHNWLIGLLVGAVLALAFGVLREMLGQG